MIGCLHSDRHDLSLIQQSVHSILLYVAYCWRYNLFLRFKVRLLVILQNRVVCSPFVLHKKMFFYGAVQMMS